MNIFSNNQELYQEMNSKYEIDGLAYN